MNKFIEHLTVEELEFVVQELAKVRRMEEKFMQETGKTENYVKLRFILIKIKNLISKYKK